MARRAVADTLDFVPHLIAYDAPIFRGASRASQLAAVLEAGGREYAAGGTLLMSGSVRPPETGGWWLPGYRDPGKEDAWLRSLGCLPTRGEPLRTDNGGLLIGDGYGGSAC